jgi:hypothetical protein
MGGQTRSGWVRKHARGPLPDGFERWSVALAPGEARASRAAQWSGALIVVDAGHVEVGCFAGSRATFVAGDVLALSCLPLRWLRNAGPDEARIVAIRRSKVASNR